MKRAWIALVPLVAAGVWEVCARSTPSGRLAEAATIQLDPTVIELGTHDVGEAVSFECQVINTSVAPVELGMPTGECGCTSLALNTSLLPAGGRAKLTGLLEVGPDESRSHLVAIMDRSGTTLGTLTLRVAAHSGLRLEPKLAYVGRFAAVEDAAPIRLRLSWSESRGAWNDSQVTINLVGDVSGSCEMGSMTNGSWPILCRLTGSPPSLYGQLDGQIEVRKLGGESDEVARARFLIDLVPSHRSWPVARAQLPAVGEEPARLDFDVANAASREMIIDLGPAFDARWKIAGGVGTFTVASVDASARQLLPLSCDLPVDDYRIRVRVIDSPH